jgi:hypothetical protein
MSRVFGFLIDAEKNCELPPSITVDHQLNEIEIIRRDPRFMGCPEGLQILREENNLDAFGKYLFTQVLRPEPRATIRRDWVIETSPPPPPNHWVREMFDNSWSRRKMPNGLYPWEANPWLSFEKTHVKPKEKFQITDSPWRPPIERCGLTPIINHDSGPMVAQKEERKTMNPMTKWKIFYLFPWLLFVASASANWVMWPKISPIFCEFTGWEPSNVAFFPGIFGVVSSLIGLIVVCVIGDDYEKEAKRWKETQPIKDLKKSRYKELNQKVFDLQVAKEKQSHENTRLQDIIRDCQNSPYDVSGIEGINVRIDNILRRSGDDAKKLIELEKRVDGHTKKLYNHKNLINALDISRESLQSLVNEAVNTWMEEQ